MAHLCIAYLVKLTKNGIIIMEIKPNINIERIETKYPKNDALYSTIEYETASQNGHLIFYDCCSKRFKSS